MGKGVCCLVPKKDFLLLYLHLSAVEFKSSSDYCALLKNIISLCGASRRQLAGVAGLEGSLIVVYVGCLRIVCLLSYLYQIHEHASGSNSIRSCLPTLTFFYCCFLSTYRMPPPCEWRIMFLIDIRAVVLASSSRF